MRVTEEEGASRRPLVRLLRGAASYGFGTLVTRSYTVLLLPVYLAYLTPSDFGILAITDMLSTPLVSVLNLCLDRAVTRFYHLWPPGDRPRQLGAIWAASLISATSLTALLIWSGPLLIGRLFTAVPFHPFLNLACLIAAFRSTSSIPLMVLRAREEAGRYASFTTLTSISGSFFIIYFIVLRRAGARGVLIATLINEIIWCCFWSLLMFRWTARGSLRGRLAAPLRYSLPLLPADLAFSVGQAFDRFLLEKYVPLSELGLYFVASRFARLFHEVNQAAKNAWIPLALRLGSAPADAGRSAIGNLASIYVSGFMVLAVLTAAFGREALSLFAAPTFLGYVVYFAALPGINLSGRNEFVTAVMVAYAVVSATLALLLVPRFGAFGAAIGFALALQILGYVSAWVSSKLYTVPFPLTRIIGLGIVGVITVASVINLPLGPMTLFVKAAVAIGYLGVVVYLTQRTFAAAQLAAQIP